MSNKKQCRVCGKVYAACLTPNRTNVFRWQDVACCPEHGAIYLDRILISRGQKDAPVVEAEAATEPTASIIEDIADEPSVEEEDIGLDEEEEDEESSDELE